MKFDRLKTMESTRRSLQEISAIVEKKLFLFGCKFLPQNKQCNRGSDGTVNTV